jgi:hypothetical protein
MKKTRSGDRRKSATCKVQDWTTTLIAAGILSSGSAVLAEEVSQQVLTALSSTTLSGYVDTSAIWKLGTDRPDGRTMPGRTFDGPDKQDGFNLHAIMLRLERPLTDGQWSAGYRTDLVFGPDANFYSSVLNGGDLAVNDFAVKQAYVALRAPVGNGVDLKLGVFDTIVGYEVFDSPANPNFSRSFGYIFEPAHHTGLLATYPVNDWLVIAAGVANTHSGGINSRPLRVDSTGSVASAAESEKTYMGGILLTVPDGSPMSGATLSAGVVNGLNGLGAEPTQKTATHIYAGSTIPTPLSGLTLGAAFDYRKDGAPVTGAGLPSDNRAYAVAGYVSYAFTDQLKLNARVDYVNADNGTFYGDPGSGAVYEVLHTASREKLLGNTLTLEYALWENVLTRAEFRWDHSLTGDRPYGNADSKNALSLAANIVYKF